MTINCNEEDDIEQLMYRMEKDLVGTEWDRAGSGRHGGGLAGAEPSFHGMARALKEFRKNGQPSKAAALEALASNSSWDGQRLCDDGKLDPAQALCTRCRSGEIDSPMHRYYRCVDNDKIEDKAIAHKMAVPTQNQLEEEPPCKWFRAITPGSLLTQPPG